MCQAIQWERLEGLLLRGSIEMEGEVDEERRGKGRVGLER